MNGAVHGELGCACGAAGAADAGGAAARWPLGLFAAAAALGAARRRAAARVSPRGS
ncbi:hypothetical protein [Sorangium cellulosum]|uniref:Uncharacterized protein n=1 Tax=Sorangium cellulosum So0157-2 TaxID=1254432 RepID=S4Y660_SORCE|nr:hypothetical protein [Sorangium cellulosum]AGP39921.1 hypothetical protein SCE1572_38765 [Sorangium cellulosum So0157-2]